MSLFEWARVCVSAQTKDLESVCMIGTQCRCVGSGCHLEKAEWAGSGREWGRLLCLPPPPPRKKLWVVWQEDKGNDGSVINQKHCDTNRERQETQPAHSHPVPTTIAARHPQPQETFSPSVDKIKRGPPGPPLAFLGLPGLLSGEKNNALHLGM